MKATTVLDKMALYFKLRDEVIVLEQYKADLHFTEFSIPGPVPGHPKVERFYFTSADKVMMIRGLINLRKTKMDELKSELKDFPIVWEK